jgi:hypothetical protein
MLAHLVILRQVMLEATHRLQYIKLWMQSLATDATWLDFDVPGGGGRKGKKRADPSTDSEASTRSKRTAKGAPRKGAGGRKQAGGSGEREQDGSSEGESMEDEEDDVASLREWLNDGK